MTQNGLKHSLNKSLKIMEVDIIEPPQKLWKNPKFFKASLIETKHVYCH